MDKPAEIGALVAGYQVWADSEAIAIDARSEAPAATTTFCAFTVSYLASRETVRIGC